jgi:ribosomal RNA-processing protein 8
MGTNWIDFIEEAYRVLRWKGELWVAEIKSRFAPPYKPGAVARSAGKRKKGAAGRKKDGARRDGEDGDGFEEVDWAVEVDDAEASRQDTDVSAFVEALRKRGFVLRGDAGEAVDLSNKMFVKIHFLKGAPAAQGKGLMPKMKDAWRAGAKKFAAAEDEDGEDTTRNEGAILKPCVYKLR